VPVQGSVIIDVRHPDEAELKPLRVDAVEVLVIPFFELHSKFAELDQNTSYMLYCDRGLMSRLHASHLLEDGYSNVSVYRPD
jgi:thiamine biosynthesis protein ThiI